MKLKRLMVVPALCLSLAASPSAFACEHSGGSGWLSFFHHCDHDSDKDNHERDKGHDQDRDHNGGDHNGGSCGGGNSTGGGSSSGGGSGTTIGNTK